MFTIGESTLELEARAEHILESAEEESGAQPANQDETPTDVRFESLEIAADDIASLEIQDAPGEDEWEEGPAEPGSTELESAELDSAGLESAERELPAPEFIEQLDRSLEFSLTPTELDRIFVEVGADSPLHEETGDASEHWSSGAPPHADAGIPVVVDLYVPSAEPEGVPAQDPAQTLLASANAHQGRRWPWVAAAVALALLLAGQIVHRNREWLAAHEPFAPAVRALYARLGAPLPVPASLAGYQLRQWGASGDATASGALRVRASILNTSAQLQPFPLLRVTLADRFGAHIGSREFEPTEYLGKPVTRLLGPGERADATVEIQDPGKNAEGFELDVCLRGADGRLRCAGDAAPQAR